jgi:general secretion pathway protein I
MLSKNKSTGQGGFSLLEILIAFSIMALSLGILLRIFSGGVNTATIAEEYTTAVQIAESLMAQTGSEIPLRSEHKSGVKDEKYNWQLDISPYKLSAETMDAKAVGVELYKINVTVDWGDEGSDGDNRKIQLATLKTLTQSNNGQP